MKDLSLIVTSSRDPSSSSGKRGMDWKWYLIQFYLVLFYLFSKFLKWFCIDQFTWSRTGAAHGPTDRLREKSLDSRDSGPGDASGTGGEGNTGDNSFSEPRRNDHLC